MARMKTARGRTPLAETPITIRASMALGARFEQRIRAQLARRVGHAASLIERGTVRFEDVNGPRGGVDTVCRIKLVISGRPVILVEKVAETPELAFASAIKVLGPALNR